MNIIDWIINLPTEFLQTFGYLIIFFLVLSEGIPPLGVFTPGQLLILFAGFLARIDVLNLYVIIIISSLGSLIGDIIGYYMGKKLGMNFLTKYGKYIFLDEKRIEKLTNTMKKHFFKSLLFSKFYGWTRVITPFMSGILHHPLKKFIFLDIIVCFVRSIFWILIGYIFGHSYEIIGAYIGKFIFVSIALGLLIIVGYNYINKKRHIFTSKYLITLAINVGSLLSIAVIIENILKKTKVIYIDYIIEFQISIINSQILNIISKFITFVSNPYFVVVIATIFMGYLFVKKMKYFSWLFFLGISGGFVMDLFIKFLLGNIKADNWLGFVQMYSFPSAYTTMATIFIFTLFLYFKNYIKSYIIKGLFGIISVLFIFMIGFNRIYLDINVFSDVMIGFLLGIFWITFMILILKFIMSNKADKDMINIP